MNKNLNFDDKWVVVTGASSGLGEAICEELSIRYNANLILVARRIDRLEKLKTRLLRFSKSKIAILQTDLSNSQELNEFFQTIDREYDIYGAVINAGMTLINPQLKIENFDIDRIVDLNIKSTILLTNFFVSHFKKNNCDGGLLYISSLSSIFPTPYQSIYSGTKAFTNNFIFALSQEHIENKFSFSIYTPGGIKTEMTMNNKWTHLDKFLSSPNYCAKIAISGFCERKLIFSSKTSIELLLGKIIPLKWKLVLMRKIYT